MNELDRKLREGIQRIQAKKFTSAVLRRRARRGKEIKVTIRNVALESKVSYSTVYRRKELEDLIKSEKLPSRDDRSMLLARVRRLQKEKVELEKAMRDLATRATYWRLAYERICRALKRDKAVESRIRKRLSP